jgi:hypothetical protein
VYPLLQLASVAPATVVHGPKVVPTLTPLVTTKKTGTPDELGVIVAVTVCSVLTGLKLVVGDKMTEQSVVVVLQVINAPLPMLTPLVIPRYTIHTTIMAPRRTTVFRALVFRALKLPLFMTFAPSCLLNLFTYFCH